LVRWSTRSVVHGKPTVCIDEFIPVGAIVTPKSFYRFNTLQDATVPEPGTIALAALGLLGIGLTGRRALRRRGALVQAKPAANARN